MKLSDITPKEELVLTALIGNKLYASEIAQAIQDVVNSSGLAYEIQPTPYSTLIKLEKRSLVGSRWEQVERRGRRYWFLTSEGATAINNLVNFRTCLFHWQSKQKEGQS